MLKADLHIHTHEDPSDKKQIKYTARDFIKKAASLGFDVLSITAHDTVVYSKKLSQFAESKGILLIPGVEKGIENRDVLIYNIRQEESDKLKSFEDLRKLREKEKKKILVIAPHPFLKICPSLREKLIENIDLFDALEHWFFHSSIINVNKKTTQVAKRYKKTIVGNSDSHNILQVNHSFTLIDSEKDIYSVFDSIRKNKVKLCTKPLKLKTIIMLLLWVVYREIFITKFWIRKSC